MPSFLVIDDDASLRCSVGRMLECAGYEMREAGDGDVGLQLYRPYGPDVVVLDIFIPERSGLEVIRHLRAEILPTTIVAMFGGGRTGTIDLLSDAPAFGASRTHWKPCELNEPLTTVRDLLGERLPEPNRPGGPSDG